MNHKNDKKPKTDLYYLIWIIIGGALGFFFVEFYTILGYPLENFTVAEFAVMVIILLLTFFLQIFLHEFGHLLFGLLSGYHFLSFRFFDIMLVKQNQKLVFRKLHIDSTAGQCLMIPPEPKNGEIPATLYNMGGVIMNLVSSFIGVIFLYKYFDDSSLSLWLFSFIVIGIVLALTNGIPIVSSTVVNDGTNALALQNNPAANRAFYLQMKMNVLQTNGITYREMPEEWFVLPDDSDMDNGLISTLAVYACSRMMEEKKFDEFIDTLNHYRSINCAFNAIHLQLMECDRLYIGILRGVTQDETDAQLSKAIKKTLKAMKSYPSVLRFQYTYHLFYDLDSAKAESIRRKFDIISRNYPYEGEIRVEKELMELAEETVKKCRNQRKNEEEKS